MKSVLLSHPHAAAFATATAAGLARRNMLGKYVTGMAVSEESFWKGAILAASGLWPQMRNRLVAAVAPSKLRSLCAVELISRTAGKLLPGRSLSMYDAMFWAHDAAAATLHWPDTLDGVYCYEDAALSCFRKARRRGIPCVWDLPLPFHVPLAEVIHREGLRWPGAMTSVVREEPEWKQRRKNLELECADVVSVASKHTASSLEGTNSRARIISIPYGFPVDRFTAKSKMPDGPFTVLSVGTHDLRKGTPYLLEAYRRANPKNARLLLVGPMRLSDEFLAPYRGLFEHIPHVARVDLAHYYRSADVLVFPTLGDGFGLVIQEAMCSGTCVVTTPSGGGPECISDGRDGWIVPAAALDLWTDAIQFLSVNRVRCHTAGQAARRRAETWTVVDSGDALAAALAEV
jgi:glycosyltransferase involved in cell wall biosynthesis